MLQRKCYKYLIIYLGVILASSACAHKTKLAPSVHPSLHKRKSNIKNVAIYPFMIIFRKDVEENNPGNDTIKATLILKEEIGNQLKSRGYQVVSSSTGKKEKLNPNTLKNDVNSKPLHKDDPEAVLIKEIEKITLSIISTKNSLAGYSLQDKIKKTYPDNDADTVVFLYLRGHHESAGEVFLRNAKSCLADFFVRLATLGCLGRTHEKTPDSTMLSILVADVRSGDILWHKSFHKKSTDPLDEDDLKDFLQDALYGFPAKTS